MAMKGIKGEKHPRAKLSDARIRRLLQLYDEGVGPKELSERFDISIGHACRLGKRKVRT